MPADHINDIIRNRRSIFPPSYTSQDIPVEIIKDLLENANCAPTHRRTEPWRFTVMKGEGLKQLAVFFSDRYKRVTPEENFSQARYDAAGQKVLQSNCVVAIHMEPHPDQVPEWEEIASVACAVQNMWLSAHAYGIGAYWSSPAFLDEIAGFLKLPENHRCLGLFYMGYHEQSHTEARRSSIDDKVTWIL
ncbi:nitroreductase family protein [Dyadobacter tibetensis]|uniref:nitroreductase family protein n=1 Tax=Dyadobacter tibetensis TaxID=1211851 RepID=UPI00046EF891|nr:nitroreductase [Dyadobacter tibetensis]